MKTLKLVGSRRSYRVSKIICVGRNYADHAKEMNADLPESPVLFLKPSTALLKDGGIIEIPSISSDCHHEVEMTILIGKGGKEIPREKALEHIAGYGIGLDMTLRDLQSIAKKQGLPWTLAKGFDTSAPISEFVPASRVRDPHTLDLQLKVNNEIRQRSNTRYFIFKIDQVIAYVSRFFTLDHGDVIFTGTPEGVSRVNSGDVLEAQLSEPDGGILTSLSVSVR